MNVKKGIGVIALTVFTVLAASPLNSVYALSQAKYKFDPDDYKNWNALVAADVQQHGASLTSLHSILLRNLRTNNPTCTPSGMSDPIQKSNINLIDDYIRLKLTPSTTSTCYSSSELYLGQSLYLDQPSLDAANARNDVRVFKPGKEMSFKARFSEAYKNGTAFGSVGIVGQGWQFAQIPDGYGGTLTVPAYQLVGFTYIPSIPALGNNPPGVYMTTVDFATNYFNLIPIPSTIDISKWHVFTSKWEVGNIITYSIDGNVIYTVNASGMRTTGEYLHVGAWQDNNGFAFGLSIQPSGNVTLTQDQIFDFKYIKVKPI